ncbi:Zn-ribbon domain-containing OB-fold protein [Wenxinia marina]|uniref:Putative nucleic-acid-binding protein n=1 Tax=Wenxinia marina DSM 24838 TaxID=1123501 RepID=A0A0D0NP87_9RHOB|nr:OB-fold domain-containing protein [Wenxinia marina]KIQ70115.1 putative nucleic-acid-binding protein [Wenxinia marina DSM 24838]GGL80884.1 DNA-binding protein [Wenxinia marina]
MTAERAIPPVRPDPESLPFWEAAREGRFLLRRCSACGQAHWFPRTLCPFCWSGDTAWEEASGLGTVYSWTVLRAGAVPNIVAYVELREGPRMLTDLVEVEPDAVAIGQLVEVVFRPTSDPDGPPVPMFRPR